MVGAISNGTMTHSMEQFPSRESHICVASVALVIFVSVFGNMFVIIVLSLVPKKDRQKTDILYISLSFSSLLENINRCLDLRTYIAGQWQNQAQFCVLKVSITNAGQSISLLHIVTITFFKYLAIVHPQLEPASRYFSVVLSSAVACYALPVYLNNIFINDIGKSSKLALANDTFFDLPTMQCEFPSRVTLVKYMVFGLVAVLSLGIVFMFVMIKIFSLMKRHRTEASKSANETCTVLQRRQNASLKMVGAFFVAYVVQIGALPLVIILDDRLYEGSLPLSAYITANLTSNWIIALNWLLYFLDDRMRQIFSQTIALGCYLRPRTAVSASGNAGLPDMELNP